jgi:hypothetical protein
LFAAQPESDTRVTLLMTEVLGQGTTHHLNQEADYPQSQDD